MEMNKNYFRNGLTRFVDKNGRRVRIGDWICFLWWVGGSDGLQHELYIYGRILIRRGKLIFKYRDHFVRNGEPYKGPRYHERRLDALNFDSESDWEIVNESCYGYGVYMPAKYE